MFSFPEGNAVVYCEGAFATTTGKTAHGLVRRTQRYKILSVIDSTQAGKDAGQALEGKNKNIPLLKNLKEATQKASEQNRTLTHFVIGLAPDGGRLNNKARAAILEAIEMGLSVDSGLHDFLSEDPEISAAAQRKNVRLRDVRKTPSRKYLHSVTGKIDLVKALKIAMLGTDAAIGKRTTAWCLVDAAKKLGQKAELIGTGQTAWLQGAKYSILLDSLINDFVAGELEHAIWTAWTEEKPDTIVIEGQGSLLNPVYPGGYEILAAGKPDFVVLQHAPCRKEYAGLPGHPIHPLQKQIDAIEMISGRPVSLITINHEGLSPEEIPRICDKIHKETKRPACDPLSGDLAEVLKPLLAKHVSL